MLFQKKPEESGNAMSPEVRPLMANTPMQPRSLITQHPDGLPPRAVIAEGINIQGCLQTDGEIQVDGTIHGDVRCKHLTIGKSGAICGDISASELVVRGKLKGAIRAQRVIIQEGAHVESDICHDTVAIEEGAYFKGCCTPAKSKEIDLPSPEPSPLALHLVESDVKEPA